jgi:hypothetical protein
MKKKQEDFWSSAPWPALSQANTADFQKPFASSFQKTTAFLRRAEQAL